MEQVRHARERRLEWQGDVAFDLLGAHPGWLGDDLDHRRDRVGIRLDVEH